jgi:hypothetical protein
MYLDSDLCVVVVLNLLNNGKSMLDASWLLFVMWDV